MDTTDINIIDLSGIKTLIPSMGILTDNILIGGCGTMYRIEITSPKFNGKAVLAQHRLVNEILQTEIKSMHGLTLKTLPATQQ